MAGKTSTIATAVVKLAADTASYTAGVNSIRKTNKGLLDEVRNNFGRGSVFTQVLKGFQGGGVLLGLGLAAREFEELTSKAADLADGIRKGEKPASDLIGDFVRGIPILGSFVKGFDNIREAITGARVELDKINEAVKVGDATAAAIKYRAEAVKDLGEKYRAITEPEDRKSALIPLTGSTKAFQQLQFEGADKFREIQQAFYNTTNPAKNEKLQEMWKGYFESLKKFNDQRAPQQSDYFTVGHGYERDPDHYNDLVEKEIRTPDVGAFNAAMHQYESQKKALDGLRDQLNAAFEDAQGAKSTALKKLFSSDKEEDFLKNGFFRLSGGSLSTQLGQNFGQFVVEGFDAAKAKAEFYSGQLSKTVTGWFFGSGEEFEVDREIGEKARSIRDSLKSPLDKLRDDQGSLDELFRGGKINANDYNLATGKAIQDFIQQTTTAPQFAPATEARTPRLAFGNNQKTAADAVKAAAAKMEQQHKEWMSLAQQWFSYVQSHTVQPVGIGN